MNPETGIKITIAKLIQVAYTKNKGLPTNIVLKKGHLK